MAAQSPNHTTSTPAAPRETTRAERFPDPRRCDPAELALRYGRPGTRAAPETEGAPVKTVKFRVRNPIKWLSPLIATVYLIGVVLLVIQNHNDLYFLTSGSGALLILLLSPVLAPLLLLLWLLDPARQVHMGEGRFVLAQGNDVLGQITYPEIAHMRITGRNRCLDVFDHAGVNRIHIEPAVFWRDDRNKNVAIAIVDFMRTQLPHVEKYVEQGKGQKAYVERYIDCFPPISQGAQQPTGQQSPTQPTYQQPTYQQSPQQPTYQQPTYQQPQGQSGWR